MMTRALTSLLLLAAACHTGLSGQLPSAQSSNARIVAFTTDPREPEFGDVFQLNVQVRVAPGVVAFLSDTLAEAANSVSAGPGGWTLTVAPADSVDVRATYPVMGLLPGAVELPSVEIWTRTPATGEAAGVRPPGSLGGASVRPPELDRALLYLGGVFIMPPSEMIGDDAMLLPRPPADVLGGERSPWLVGAFAVAGLAAVVVAWLLLQGRRGGTSEAPALLLSPREEALRELDRVRELGWHSNGHVMDFYLATTGVLRRYAERRESEWGTALTSSELLARLRERRGRDAVEPLGPTIWTAECVKFGGREPGTEAAAEDWSKVRDWIADEDET